MKAKYIPFWNKKWVMQRQVFPWKVAYFKATDYKNVWNQITDYTNEVIKVVFRAAMWKAAFIFGISTIPKLDKPWK